MAGLEQKNLDSSPDETGSFDHGEMQVVGLGLWESKQGDRISVPTMLRAVRPVGVEETRGRWEPPDETIA